MDANGWRTPACLHSHCAPIIFHPCPNPAPLPWKSSGRPTAIPASVVRRRKSSSMSSPAGTPLSSCLPAAANRSAYQIPSLCRPGVGVVVSPLIALMQDQVDALTQIGVRAAAINSSMSAESIDRTTRQIRAGELDLIYVRAGTPAHERFSRAPAGMPGRLVRHRRGALRLPMGPRFPPALCAA